MARDTATAAAKNKRIRQEAMREALSAKALENYVIDIAEKLHNEAYKSKDDESRLDVAQVQALKASADIRLKLINKYLPDLKATEITGAEGEAVAVDLTWKVKVVE